MKRTNYIIFKLIALISIFLPQSSNSMSQELWNRVYQGTRLEHPLAEETTYELMQREQNKRQKINELAEEFNLFELIKTQECEELGDAIQEFLTEYHEYYPSKEAFDLERITTHEGETLLKLAVENRATECISTLLSFGCDINGVDENGDSYLMLAVKSGDLNVVKAFFPRRRTKLNVNYVNNINGLSALKIAEQNNSKDIANFLLRNGAVT